MSQLNRRQFIKIGATGAAAAAFGSALPTQWWGLDRSYAADPNTDGDKVVPTFCELCFWKCGLLAHVKHGQVTKLVGNPKHPLSKGKLCPRGYGGTGLLYDPDRLKKPLIRVNKRGDDTFEEASWDAALDLVAENLLKIKKEHGPEAVALFTHGFGGGWFKHLLKAYGSRNIGAPSYAQCRGPREVGYGLTFGQGLGSPEPIDIENARVITLIGAHLGENMHNTQVQEFANAVDRGVDLVVVDPRYSVAASKARYWLPIKPGTDTALLLAWMNVIIEEKRYDRDFVEQYTYGFEDLEEHVKNKTPEWAYPITGLKPELIRESARLISGARPNSLIHPGRRTTWYGNDTQRARAMAIITALLGSWGREGGYLLTSRMHVPAYPYPPYAQSPKGIMDRPEEGLYPLADEMLASGLCEATIRGIDPVRLKGWMVYGTNLIQSLPNPKKTIEAIQALEFIVAIDVLPAEITGWADVVLPESTYLERFDDVWPAPYKQPFVAARQPAVEPMYDSKPGWWIAKELGNRMGLEAYFPWKDSVEYARERIRTAGLNWDELMRDGVVLGKKVPTTVDEGLVLAFDTPTGKVELKSDLLASAGFDPLPNYTPVEEPPPEMFRLLMGRAPVHTFGRTTNNRLLADCYPENEVWINSDAARALAAFSAAPLKTGDRVVLVNQDGVRSNPVKARVTERIRGDAVFMVHGFGHSAKGLKFAKGRGASDTELITNFETDPIMGGTGMNVNFVSIERAGGAA